MNKNKKKVCVIGLGFVGSAMLISIANKCYDKFNLIGIEKNNLKGKEVINKLNNGIFPISTNDKLIIKLCRKLALKKKYYCTTDIKQIENAEIIIIDINLDLKKNNIKDPQIKIKKYLDSFNKILKHVRSSPLFIIQTTLPPGFTDHYIRPIIQKNLNKNKININQINLSFSYERVMPGEKYLDSIINNWRVVGGVNNRSILKTKKFFESFINTKKFPITILPDITSAELAKIIENSYRAVNIAFIEEWSRLSEALNIDIYKIISAIKIRPTHINLSKPGFGVGGYCLTKDPLFGVVSNNMIYKKNLKFPFSTKAIEINRNMPNQTLNLAKKYIKNFKNKKIAIFGVSYKEDVGDIRYSPSIYIAKKLNKLGSKVFGYDPLVEKCDNFYDYYSKNLPETHNLDLIIIAVPHKIFSKIKFHNYLKNKKTIIIDAFNVLNENQIKLLRKNNFKLISIGRGNA